MGRPLHDLDMGDVVVFVSPLEEIQKVFRQCGQVQGKPSKEALQSYT